MCASIQRKIGNFLKNIKKNFVLSKVDHINLIKALKYKTKSKGKADRLIKRGNRLFYLLSASLF